MKPTKPGWYWLRQNYKHLVTQEITKARWEVALVCMGAKRRSRKPDLVLWMATSMHGGFQAMLSEVPDYWDWSEAIAEPA